MNDKKIKAFLQDIIDCNFIQPLVDNITSDVAKDILDYITNLQQIEQDHQKLNGELREKLEDYKSRIDKSNEFIKENTRWFDSEYAKIYGELCDCEGAKDNRLEVLVNPSNLSKILGGDKDVKD